MEELKFGERIRTIRKKAGYNQTEFCSLLDIPQSTLSAYETDRMQPTIVTLVNIATKFNVSLDWLCGIEKNADDYETISVPSDETISVSSEIKGSLDNILQALYDIRSAVDKAFVVFPSPAAVRAMDVCELELSSRSFNSLKHSGLNTVGDIEKLTAKQLMRVRNLGRQSYDEVIKKLEALGIKLREGEEDPN